MNKKLLLILSVSILTLALLVFFTATGWNYFTQKESGKCGDGICDSIEKNKGICPDDCEKKPEGTCKDLCGDGTCQEVVCLAVGCPCAETFESCSEDCDTTGTIQQPPQSEKPKGELLPDLVQQSASLDFIYSIWLGRGLYSNEELDRGFEVASNLGVKYFMVEFKWGYVEPQNDQWQWSNEETIDVEHVIELAKKYNLSIIPYYEPHMPWGEKIQYADCEGIKSRFGQYHAPDPDEYAEYGFEVVNKLKTNGVDVKYVAIDNENSNQNDGYQSWTCFLNVTAKDIKEYQNALYDKIKATYPEIMISSTTFGFPGLSCSPNGPDCEKDKERKNSFIKAYFEDDPKPKFDFLGVHEVFGGSGNPYTTWEKSANATYEYNFGSYNDAYDMWREILDKYGYTNTPIFNLESGAIKKDLQDADLILKAVFAKSNSDKNKVMGWVVSQLTGSKKFTEAVGKTNFNKSKGPSLLGSATIGIAYLANDYELREGYYGYYAMMNTLANYPNYGGKAMGQLNSPEPWVEKFSNSNGNMLYVGFIPHNFGAITPKIITLNIGANKEVKITKSDTTTSAMKSDSIGNISLEISEHPIFIEEK